MSIKIWGLIVLLCLLVVFSLQNTEPIRIKFLVWQVNTSSAFVMILPFLLGLGAGWLIRALRRPSSN